MINYIEGKVLFSEDEKISILTNGIGYEVHFVNKNKDDFLSLFIYNQINERGSSLWGFSEYESYLLFKELINVDMIGTQKAFHLINEVGCFDLIKLIMNKDESISKVKGLGKKSIDQIFTRFHENKKINEKFMEMI